MKKSRVKGLSPEEARKKEQREKEKREREEAQKAQRVIANLEKQRERERAEKLERERRERLKVEKEKEKLEKEMAEVAERARKEKIRLRNIERNRCDTIMEGEIAEARKEKEASIKIDKANLLKDWNEKEKIADKRVAALKTEYEKLIKVGEDSRRIEKIKKDLEFEDSERKTREEELKANYDQCVKNRSAELDRKIDMAMKKCDSYYPYSTEPSESGTDTESQSGDENVTMMEVRGEAEEEKVSEDDYEGIKVMKEKIIEIEDGCRIKEVENQPRQLREITEVENVTKGSEETPLPESSSTVTEFEFEQVKKGEDEV